MTDVPFAENDVINDVIKALSISFATIEKYAWYIALL
jgi:hypothetical protein